MRDGLSRRHRPRRAFSPYRFGRVPPPPTFPLLYPRSHERDDRQANCNGVVSRAARKSPPCTRSAPLLPEMGYFLRVLPFALLHRNCADTATDGRIIRNRSPVLSGMAYLSRMIPLRMQAPAGRTARFASKRHFARKPRLTHKVPRSSRSAAPSPSSLLFAKLRRFAAKQAFYDS